VTASLPFCAASVCINCDTLDRDQQVVIYNAHA
jgi:hypothetical protein